jgi:hypothetical protein
MAVIKNKQGDGNSEYWKHIEEMAEEVKKWPQWMGSRNGTGSEESAGEDSGVKVRSASAGGGEAGKK